MPESNKPKAKPFKFTDLAGVEHTLPFASEGAADIPGRLTRDAIVGEDSTAEARLSFALLEACGAKPETIDALYALPSIQMMGLLSEWMFYGDGDGATVPQS